MKAPASAPVPVLQVFTKAPVRGHVKTRLAEEIGEAAALDVHVALVERALQVAGAARDEGTIAAIELWCHPDVSHPHFARWSASYGASLRAQQGEDLGARMRHALATTVARGGLPVLIGTDCPALTPGHVAAARAALRDHDAAFIPSEDGGYVLVGMRRMIECFTGVPWGTARVMAATRSACQAAGARWRELPPLWDVDMLADYERWRSLPR